MCLVHLYIHHVWLSSLAYGKYLIDVDPKNVCYIGKKKKTIALGKKAQVITLNCSKDYVNKY